MSTATASRHAAPTDRDVRTGWGVAIVLGVLLAALAAAVIGSQPAPMPPEDAYVQAVADAHAAIGVDRDRLLIIGEAVCSSIDEGHSPFTIGRLLTGTAAMTTVYVDGPVLVAAAQKHLC